MLLQLLHLLVNRSNTKIKRSLDCWIDEQLVSSESREQEFQLESQHKVRFIRLALLPASTGTEGSSLLMDKLITCFT